MWCWLYGLALAADFSRVAADDTTVSLELAGRSYAHEDGSIVDLVGVAHIGLPDFYSEVDSRLSQADVVLYEGVGGVGQTESGLNGAFAELALGLGLVFQLDVIDYTHTHWRNSDLSVDELSGARAVQVVQGSSELRTMRVLARRASRSSRIRVMAKLMLVESLPRSEGSLEQTMGPQLYQSLVLSRNDVVDQDLQELRGQHVAVLYGAAHLPDLEARLLARQFRPVHEWLTAAITVSPAVDGVEPKMIRSVRERVLRKLGRAGAMLYEGRGSEAAQK